MLGTSKCWCSKCKFQASDDVVTVVAADPVVVAVPRGVVCEVCPPRGPLVVIVPPCMW